MKGVHSTVERFAGGKFGGRKGAGFGKGGGGNL